MTSSGAHLDTAALSQLISEGAARRAAGHRPGRCGGVAEPAHGIRRGRTWAGKLLATWGTP
jgi:hypothetical protein